MKKSLLALAVAAALPAVSQAQTNVTLYGIADAAVEYQRVDQDLVGGGSVSGNDVRVTNGVWSGSRVGLQGSEDLGGGLRGIFNFEHRISIDTGTQTNAGVSGSSAPVTNSVSGNVTGSFWQQSYVGLAGGFGEIRLGRDYTVGFRAMLPGDVTGYSFYNNLTSGSDVTGTNNAGLGGLTIRVSNAVQYITPSLGGFKLWAQYAAGEQTAANIDNNKLGDLWQVGGIGNWGPVGIGLFYGSQKVGAPVPGAPAAAVIPTTDTDQYGVALGGKFGGFGLGLGYVETKPDAGEKSKGAYISTSVGFGASTVYLVGKRSEIGDYTDTGVALSYTYALSKRTLPYFSVGYNKIEDFPAGTISSSKPISVALGLRHYF